MLLNIGRQRSQVGRLGKKEMKNASDIVIIQTINWTARYRLLDNFENIAPVFISKTKVTWLIAFNN